MSSESAGRGRRIISPGGAENIGLKLLHETLVLGWVFSVLNSVFSLTQLWPISPKHVRGVSGQAHGIRWVDVLCIVALSTVQTGSLALTKASLLNDETNARHAIARIMLVGFNDSGKPQVRSLYVCILYENADAGGPVTLQKRGGWCWFWCRRWCGAPICQSRRARVEVPNLGSTCQWAVLKTSCPLDVSCSRGRVGRGDQTPISFFAHQRQRRRQQPATSNQHRTLHSPGPGIVVQFSGSTVVDGSCPALPLAYPLTFTHANSLHHHLHC
jgi:hypothetical protein